MSTQVQATVGQVLDELKFKFIPDPSGLVGGDTAYEITDEGMRLLQEAKDRDDRIIVKHDGTISFSQF